MTYQEQMNTSQWRNKRVEILMRDEFKCQHPNCGSKATLEIHHKDYIPGNSIWDYPNDMLTTLCRRHHSVEQNREKAEIHLIFSLKMSGFLLTDILALSCKLDTNPEFANSLLKLLRNG